MVRRFQPIQQVVVRHRQTLRRCRLDNHPGAYVLIVRAPDGRPRVERFDDAAAYKARVVALQRSDVDSGSLSIGEIVEFLD